MPTPMEIATTTFTKATDLKEELNPTGFVDDLYNSTHSHLADSFDELETVLRLELGERLQPGDLATIFRGVSMLYADLKLEVDAQLYKFEQHALATCLHIPAGLITDSSAAAEATCDLDFVESEEAAIDAELKELRRKIANAKMRNRRTAAELIKLDADLVALNNTTALANVVTSIPGKENLAEDASAVAAAGVALQSGITELDRLRAEKTSSTSVASMMEKSEADAERDVLRKVFAAQSAPTEDLARLCEMLTSQ